MVPTSLGFRTDLMFHRHGGVLTDRGDYIVVETPANPAFYYGNMLYFARPPEPGDEARWPALFARELGGKPGIRHVTLGWDKTDGSLGAAAAFDGFTLRRDVILSARHVRRPSKCAHHVRVAPLLTDAEYEQAIAIQVRCREPGHEKESYERFTRRQFDLWRTMAERGEGTWFGAFVGDRLAATLGLYFDGELGRFQAVATDPEYQRRGLCGRLVFETASWGLTRARLLVMVADETYHAARIYESVGFLPTENSITLCRWPSD